MIKCIMDSAYNDIYVLDEDNFMSKYGKSLIGYDVSYLLENCCRAGKAKIVKWLINECYCCWDVTSFDCLFALSCKHGQIDVAKMLLFDEELDADISVMKHIDNIYEACKNGHNDFIFWFLSTVNIVKNYDESDLSNNPDKIFFEPDEAQQIMLCLCDDKKLDEYNDKIVELLLNFVTFNRNMESDETY